METLVVVSKIKKLIKEKYGMNTSASAIEQLSTMVEKICDDASHKASEDKRKTIMDRDFE